MEQKIQKINPRLERSMADAEINSLITAHETTETKPCAYPSCDNQIPTNNEFRYCEACRTLANRNALTILLDPSAPFTDRVMNIFHTLLHNLRPEELIRGLDKLEIAYLEFQKTVKANQLELRSTKKVWKSLESEIEEARELERAPKARAKREKRKEKGITKLTSLLGCDEKTAKDIMGDGDLGDL